MRRDPPDAGGAPPRDFFYGDSSDVARRPAPAVEYTLTPRTERRGCFHLSPFVIAVLVLVLSCVCLGAAGVGLSQVAASRTNVLILGLDRRPQQGDVVRSDVLMLATADPREPRLGLLSIPRDLYVEIPGHGQSRINAAHFYGERANRGKGPDLAMETVARNFGVPVHHYVRVDFDAFRAVVDAVGGIDVTVEERIVDNAYPTEDYGTKRIEIPAGPQHMDGERALQYVRSRHGASDFERAARQQQVMVALAQRLASPQTWPRLPAVLRAVMRHVETNLGPLEILQMGVTALRVGADGIEHRVIERDMTQPWTTPTGGAVLLPRWDLIEPVVKDLFGT